MSPCTFIRSFSPFVLARHLLSLLSLVCFAVTGEAAIGVSLQMQLGDPSGAVIDPTNHDHYLQQHDQYIYDFSDHNGEPNWVSWDLTTADLGASGRSNNFLPDPDLPNTFYHVVTTDYTGSGYDRGHMCPSADRTIDTEDNQITFYLGQIVPQAPDNNQGVWANFENYCRSLASAGNELLITSGPSGASGSRIPSGVAAIPGYTWKVVVVVPLGPGSAVSRVTSSTRVIAIKVPNIAGVRTTPWENFVTSPAQIETDTGLTFFTNLPVPVANALRTVVDGQSAVGAPAIVAQPSPQTTVIGGSATFSVVASGDAPLNYQWLKNDDVSIDGATTSTLTLSNVQASDLGTYYVVVSNAVGSATSNLTPLIILGLPPTITTSPASQIANAGSSVTFSVAVSGSPTFSYQWRKNGVPIPAATASALTLANVQDADTASYDVIVTNSVNSVTSAAATLLVNPAAPTVSTQPLSRTANTGGSASFTVTAAGTAPLMYQWRKDGTPLTDGGIVSGSVTSTLLLASLSAADGGTYDVVVTNGLGSATSNGVLLTINPPAPSAVIWNFGPSTSPTADPSSGLTPDLLGGTLTQGNNNGTTPLITTTSASSGYVGASGSNNAGAAARTGPLTQAANGSAYFEFTLAPSAGKRLLATGLNFGMRSTTTGPQAFGIFTSLDGFATAVATSAVPNDGNWHRYTPALGTILGEAGNPITYRIYGYNGVGTASQNTANWRLDDLALAIDAVFPPSVAPQVTSTSPTDGAAGVAAATSIVITFNEAVSFTGSWFSISSALNGPLAATVTGGPTTFTLTPPSFFANNDTLTVTILGAQIVDQATGIIHGTSNTTFSFATEAFVPPISPTITRQPVSVTANAGSTASFTVTTAGTLPLAYQWRKAGVNLTGNASATTAMLTLTNLTTEDAGSYDCVVSNVAGNDISQSALLTVLLVPPSITTPPVGQIAALGGSATFTVVASGTAPLTYQWRKDGSPLADSATISGAATAMLTLTNLTLAQSGSYDVVLTNAAGIATSSPATLAVTDAAPGLITWDFTTASPTSGLPPGLTGGTLTQGNNNGTTPLITAVSVSNGYAGASAGNNAGAAARVGPLNSGANGSAYFEFTLTPAAGRQLAATAISFGLRSTGTGPKAYAIFSSVDNFTAPLATDAVFADSAWHLITPVFRGVTGSAGVPVTFRIFGYDGAGSPAAGTANWRIDDLKLTAGVLAAALPPVITTQPVAKTGTVGDDVTFSVAASGAAPLTYRWRKDGVELFGPASAGTATLIVYSVAAVDVGSYDCVVSNLAGSTASSAATLTVNKISATVTLGELHSTFDGGPHRAAAMTSVPGLSVVITYDGNIDPPINAGSYAVVAMIDDPDFAGTASGVMVIDPAGATVAFGSLSESYDGSSKPVSVTTNPAGLPVVVTYNGALTPPISVGNYDVAATVNDQNYNGAAHGTLNVAKANAAITFSNLVRAYDGASKSPTVTTTPANLSVTTTYNGSADAPTNPGTYPVVTTVTDPNFTGSATDNLVITVTALVRHAPVVNGGIEGSLQLLLGENVSLNSSAWLSGDFLTPGLPTIALNGHPTYVGTRDGTGAMTPADYTIIVNSGAVLQHVVRRSDALAFPSVTAPSAPTGTRDVTLNSSLSAGDFATIHNLTLNNQVGQIVVPAGSYGNFNANNGSGFTLGQRGATTPMIYTLQGLTLNSGSQLEILSPVLLTLANGTSFNASVGAADHPEWLTLAVASGGITINSHETLNGSIVAPTGTVTIYGTVNGTTASDRLTVSSTGLLAQP